MSSSRGGADKGKGLASTTSGRGSGSNDNSRRRRQLRIEEQTFEANVHYDTSYQPSEGFQHVSQDFLDSLSRETINRLQHEEDLQEDLRRRQTELTHELFRSPSSVHFEQGNQGDGNQGGGNEGGGGEEMNDDQERPHSDGEDAEDEGRRQGRTLKSTLFTKHFRKVRSSSQKRGQQEVFDIFCNYCDKKYTFNDSGGYGTFRRHIIQKHPKEEGMASNQSQLQSMFASTGGGGTSQSPLFTYDEQRALLCVSNTPVLEGRVYMFSGSNVSPAMARRMGKGSLTLSRY